MEFYNDHKKLFRAALALYLALTLFTAIIPGFRNEEFNIPLPGSTPLSADAMAGKRLFIANGCVGCHTQQVRDVDMDKTFGSRPSVAADYARIHRPDLWHNTATLMGSERTGPDLTNIGARQPLESWHLLHLFNPRTVVRQSIMPAYPWLFAIKDSAEKGDVTVAVPDSFMDGETGKVVATREALQLVAYLQSLKQVDISDRPVPAFLYPTKKTAAAGGAGGPAEADGATLYASNCQTCHQPNGEGLKGAFPSLKGSKIVNDDNPETHLDIIMNGYNGDASEGYGPMPAVGTMNHLTAAEIAAIMNYERSSWGNNGKKVDVAGVDKLMTSLKK